MNKKILSLVIAIVMVLGSFTSVFAADWDLLHKLDPNKNTDMFKFAEDPDTFMMVADDFDNYELEINGKLYSVKDIQAKLDAGAKDLAEAISLIDKDNVLKVVSVEAVNKTTIKVKFNNNEVATITEFAPSPLVPGQTTTVTFTYAGKTFVENVKYDIGYSLEIVNKEALVEASDNGELLLDGKTVIKVVVKVNVPEGEDPLEFAGQAEFFSKQGFKPAHSITAFDLGKVTFNISLPSSKVDLEDEIKVVLKEHENAELRGLESETLKLQYKAYKPGEGGSTEITTKAYNIDSVKSLDLGDRVAVYVSNVEEKHKEDIKKAILDQVKIYNNRLQGTTVATIYQEPIDLVKIIDAKPISETNNSYAFTALVNLKPFDATGYDRVDQITNAALIDNQYNYYEVLVAAPANKIYLNTKAQHLDNKFMVRDSVVPRIERIVTPKVIDGELVKGYLEPKQVVAYFSEAVSRLTAENPNNWIINGNRLNDTDVDFIRVMDISEKENASGKALLGLQGVSNRENDYPRTTVVIQLKHRAERLYLRDGENLIQARTIADIAGLSDLSDNNKITTQDFLFNYSRPDTTPALNIIKESPEQYVLSLNDELYTDENITTKLNLDTQANLKVELVEKVGVAESITRLLTDTEYRIVKLGTTDKFIIELTRDWTRLLQGLAGKPAYHGKYFRVTIVESLYDLYGNTIYDKTIVDPDNKPLVAEVLVPEDTVSPEIEDIKIGTGTHEGKPSYKQPTDAPVIVTMNEPVQIVKYNNITNALESLMAPAMTPSLEQGDKVPVPTFEYVKVKDTDGNLLSDGKRVAGEIYDTPVDEHDITMKVRAVENLEDGHWKLVVREISDDVGNTMKTEEFPFVVLKADPVGPVDPTVDNLINPYVIWAYADDDKLETDGTYNDYVYILYSRQMSIDAIRAVTYNINGKQVNQDADITAEDIVLWRQNCDVTNANYSKFYGVNVNGKPNHNEWKAQLVTIKLPSDFIVGGDDYDGDRNGIFRKNVLTLPRDLSAVNDNVEATQETLLFTNNGGDNQFELTFYNDGVYGAFPLLPKCALNIAMSKYFTAKSYQASMVKSTPEDVEDLVEDIPNVDEIPANDQVAIDEAAAKIAEAIKAYNSLSEAERNTPEMKEAMRKLQEAKKKIEEKGGNVPVEIAGKPSIVSAKIAGNTVSVVDNKVEIEYEDLLQTLPNVVVNFDSKVKVVAVVNAKGELKTGQSLVNAANFIGYDANKLGQYLSTLELNAIDTTLEDIIAELKGDSFKITVENEDGIELTITINLKEKPETPVEPVEPVVLSKFGDVVTLLLPGVYAVKIGKAELLEKFPTLKNADFLVLTIGEKTIDLKYGIDKDGNEYWNSSNIQKIALKDILNGTITIK